MDPIVTQGASSAISLTGTGNCLPVVTGLSILMATIASTSVCRQSKLRSNFREEPNIFDNFVLK